MKRLLLAASVFAAMCGVTAGTLPTDFAPAANAATAATVATIDVYKDAS